VVIKISKKKRIKKKKFPRYAIYNKEGKEICPACEKRIYKIDYVTSTDKEKEVEFTAICPCGHKFKYRKDIRNVGGGSK